MKWNTRQRFFMLWKEGKKCVILLWSFRISFNFSIDKYVVDCDICRFRRAFDSTICVWSWTDNSCNKSPLCRTRPTDGIESIRVFRIRDRNCNDTAPDGRRRWMWKYSMRMSAIRQRTVDPASRSPHRHLNGKIRNENKIWWVWARLEWRSTNATVRDEKSKNTAGK